MLEKINEYALKIAMFGNLGTVIGGGIIASLFAIPLLLLARIVWMFSFQWYLIGILAFVAFCLIVIQLSLRAISDNAPSSIVLDKVLGMTLVFVGISFSLKYWKLFLLAFVLFHVLNLFSRPLFMLNKICAKIDSMHNVIGIVASDVFFGVLVNVIIRLGMLFFYR